MEFKKDSPSPRFIKVIRGSWSIGSRGNKRTRSTEKFSQIDDKIIL